MEQKTIKLTQGYEAILDHDDWIKVKDYSWCISKCKNKLYAKRGIRVNGKHRTIRMHREIMGVTDPTVLVDHKNGDGLDCTRENLRITCYKGNNRNLGKHKSDSCTSKFKGVGKHHGGKWRSRIRVDGKEMSLGHFDCEIQAATAYNNAAIEHFGEFARLNNGI